MTLQFAFYGRVSTEDQQDPETSRNWQLIRARGLTDAHGHIVTEYFDVGHTRALPWKRRPEASRLLAALADPMRGFDAVVIGEPQRAFYDNQYGLTFPVFNHYGVGLWVPEVGGPIDPTSEAHDLIMGVFGGMSKGERNRIKIRVRTAMQSQTQIEGRYLGGRPPYGYRLADAGPTPTRRRLPTENVSTDWNPTRKPHRSSRESSASTCRAPGFTRSLRDSPATTSPAPVLMTANATRTEAAWPGPRAPSEPS